MYYQLLCCRIFLRFMRNLFVRGLIDIYYLVDKHLLHDNWFNFRPELSIVKHWYRLWMNSVDQ